MKSSAGPVLVGIDGSNAAINAARWAIREATCRDVPLRLVYVTPPVPTAGDVCMDLEYAEAALRAASAAVDAAAIPVKVETAVLHGKPDAVLTGESRGASMVCVGSVGIGRVASALLGSTAAALAQLAHCPAAIIRSYDDSLATVPGYIAVAVTDRHDNHAVLNHAFDEARLRETPILVLGVEPSPGERNGCLARWQQRYPDVRVTPIEIHTSLPTFLETYTYPDTVRLAVIDGAEASQVKRLVGPHGHRVLAHANCTVLIVRG